MKLYVTDGSAKAFFTAVFDAYNDGQAYITSDPNFQLKLDDEIINVTYDEQKCERVLNAIIKYDFSAESDIMLALRSGDGDKDNTVFGYIRCLIKRKAPVKNMLTVPEVLQFNNTLYKITGEIHRLKGLLRFMESADGILYAPYSPDNDITECLMPHFAARLKCEKFIIHDVKRKTAGIYDGKSWAFVCVGDGAVSLSDAEADFVRLWKKYYGSVNIKERPHEKQMKRSMPVRYWKFLPEKNGGR